MLFWFVIFIIVVFVLVLIALPVFWNRLCNVDEILKHLAEIAETQNRVIDFLNFTN